VTTPPDQIAKALADPQRFAILSFVCDRGRDGSEVGCKEVVAKFPVSQATISHHLKELQHAGLVTGRREGQCLMLRPVPDALASYVDHLRSVLTPA
jgi:ArsR family transcriptional regulator